MTFSDDDRPGYEVRFVRVETDVEYLKSDRDKAERMMESLRNHMDNAVSELRVEIQLLGRELTSIKGTIRYAAGMAAAAVIAFQIWQAYYG